MKDILATLISFQTVTGHYDANHEGLDYIDHFLSERGLFVKRLEFDGYESLVATTQHTKTPQIMLVAHLDVVSAPMLHFQMTEHDDKLWGRGVLDMKFAIAAYLQLVDDLQDKLREYDFGIMITTDEETGGRHGAKRLVEAGYLPKACVIPDGGENWALEEAAKGVAWIRATATGKTAHASRPWNGESAIEKMILFLQAMQGDLFSQQGLDTSTCNIGTIHAGEVRNQVSDLCTSDIDIRFIDTADQHRIIGRISELGKLYDITIEVILNDQPIQTDLADPYVLAYVASVEKVIGRPVQTMRSFGGSDARYFAPHGIPTLVMYPTGGGSHTDEEWIETKSFYLFRDVLEDYVNQTARTSTRDSAR